MTMGAYNNFRFTHYGCLIVSFMVLGGCSAIDRVDTRATVMNEAISEASNKGILLNLARASLAEPLSFSALANFQGHNTLTGSFAYPGFTATTNQLRIQNISVTGPSTGGTLGSDFNFIGNDDSATYNSLLKPIDPLTIAFFLRQEYNKELLFYLAMQDIRVTRKASLVDDFPNNPVTKFPNLNTNGQPDFARFGDRLQELVQAGFTVQLNLNNNTARICFQRESKPYYPQTVSVKLLRFEPSCSDNLPPVKDPGKNKFQASYRVHNVTEGTDWDISFRSVFGIYRYLGTAIAQGAVLKVLGDPNERDPLIMNVTNGNHDCFVDEEYRGRVFCVPNSAYTTKRVFTLLHDLVKLSTPTAPTPPPTVTTRSIGGT